MTINTRNIACIFDSLGDGLPAGVGLLQSKTGEKGDKVPSPGKRFIIKGGTERVGKKSSVKSKEKRVMKISPYFKAVVTHTTKSVLARPKMNDYSVTQQQLLLRTMTSYGLDGGRVAEQMPPSLR